MGLSIRPDTIGFTATFSFNPCRIKTQFFSAGSAPVCGGFTILSGVGVFL